MTTDQVQAIGPEFTAFLRPFERFFDTLKTVRHFRTYTRGLLSDLPRKTAEPIATQAGTPPRNLQQFLKACLWDHAGVTDAVQRTVRAAVADLPADPVGTVGQVPKPFPCRPGRSREKISARAVFSRPGVRRRAARSFGVAQQTGPAAVWQVKVVDVALGHDRRPRHRLILARNRQTGER